MYHHTYDRSARRSNISYAELSESEFEDEYDEEEEDDTPQSSEFVVGDTTTAGASISSAASSTPHMYQLGQQQQQPQQPSNIRSKQFKRGNTSNNKRSRRRRLMDDSSSDEDENNDNNNNNNDSVEEAEEEDYDEDEEDEYVDEDQNGVGDDDEDEVVVEGRHKQQRRSSAGLNPDHTVGHYSSSGDKKACVICGKPASKKNYTTRLYLDAYMTCFPQYDGTIGFVCSTCYNRCYTMRKTGEWHPATPSSESKAINLTTTAKNNKSKKTGGTRRKRRKLVSKEKVKPPSPIVDRSTTPPPSNTTNTNIIAKETLLQRCTSCGGELGKRSYLYHTFASEYSELFPDSTTDDSTARSCHTCHIKAQALREFKCSAIAGEEEKGTDIPENDSANHEDAPEEQTNSHQKEQTHHNEKISSGGSSVQVFLDFRFLNNVPDSNTSPKQTIIRVDLPPKILVSEFSTLATSFTEQVFPDSSYQVHCLRRVSKDYYGFEVQQNMLFDEHMQIYPVNPMERFIVYLK